MNPSSQRIRDYSAVLKNRASFLDVKGFIVSNETEHSITFSSASHSIEVVFERYEDFSDVSIRFLDENKVFSIGWIITVFKEVHINDYLINKKDKLMRVLGLLMFLEDYFVNITDIKFCDEMMILVEEYLK